MYSHGAQFAEVRVDADTWEIRVARMVGVFAVGRVLNGKTVRSQLLGGMAWGLSMALLEDSVLDPRYGDYANADLAEYHVAVNADVGEIDVGWIDEEDPYVNPMGAKGVGEIGIVGAAAAIANARAPCDRRARARPADHARRAAADLGGGAWQPRCRRGAASTVVGLRVGGAAGMGMAGGCPDGRRVDRAAAR
jgi:CO/xanthine dehydrogenase Mo-binding subunit